MPKGVYERNPKEPDMSPPNNTSPSSINDAARTAMASKVQVADTPVAEKLFPVLLTKNYMPMLTCKYEIVGYTKEAVKRKNAAGTWRVVEPEEFIKGEMKPHASPGVGFANKIWAGTTIRIPLDEAKRLMAVKAAERADDLAA